MITTAIVVFLVLSHCSGQGFIKVENYHPPHGYQPVRGYEPPNYQQTYYHQTNYKQKQQAQHLHSQNWYPQNGPDSWRRTPPSTRFTTTTKWTSWTQPTAWYTTPAPFTFSPFTTTTTVDWKQVFSNSGSTAKTNFIDTIQNGLNPSFGVTDQCLKCLCFIESWCSDVGCVMDQGSLSCGWYQLKYEYWLDCGQPGGGWKECSNSKNCAEGCVRAYMNRYSSFCSLGSTCAHMGRIHNGGPNGCANNNTEYYGWLIDRCLKRQAPYEKIDTF
ncbi:lysozyme [Brachionus plicatilis]|uniref:lysozyme n=1 Tax=Brachionus plicatilis TaxID=10195 RepID=A0A3M7SAZ8_BRAPC|nr:lysozyme [Brachionus plicatilis]